MRLTAAALLSAIAVSARPDPNKRLTKPPLHPNLNYLDAGLEQYLPETNYTLNKWNNDYIPEECKKIVTGVYRSDTRFSPNDMEIYDVHYADCGDPWVFCHHRNSTASIDTMARQVGKLPIQMRQWLRHVVDLPDRARHAYEVNGIITFFSAGENMMNFIIHETGHSLDLSGAFLYKPLSSADHLWAAYDNDTHVPDPYSATNMVENVAQNIIVATYDYNVPGGYPSVEPKWAGIVNQLSVVETEALKRGEGVSLLELAHGGSCTHRMPASKPVPKSESAKRRGAPPDVSLKSGVQEIDTSSRKQMNSNCRMTW